MRYRVYDWRTGTNGPAELGICQGDVPQVCQVLNDAQRRLISAKEAGEEGWWGTWAEVAFVLSRVTPYITLPREIARLESTVVCDRPIHLHNQFYEYMEYGNGRLPKHHHRHCSGWPLTQAFSRNNVPTFIDLNPLAPQYIAVYATDVTDIEASKRVFISGFDQNGNRIYTQDNGVNVQGVFLNLVSPFVTTPMLLQAPITGIQKDVTNGQVQFWQLDPTTGLQTLILTMEPGEQVASYRRYYYNALPRSCCPVPPTVSQTTSGGLPTVPPTTTTSPCTQFAEPIVVRAIAKLEPIAVTVDTDYLTLQGEGVLEALTDEAQAKRYSRMDAPEAKQMSRERHQSAVSLLNGILNHYIGKNSVAVNFRPFGSADLSKVHVGMI